MGCVARPISREEASEFYSKSFEFSGVEKFHSKHQLHQALTAIVGIVTLLPLAFLFKFTKSSPFSKLHIIAVSPTLARRAVLFRLMGRLCGSCHHCGLMRPFCPPLPFYPSRGVSVLHSPYHPLAIAALNLTTFFNQAEEMVNLSRFLLLKSSQLDFLVGFSFSHTGHSLPTLQIDIMC